MSCTLLMKIVFSNIIEYQKFEQLICHFANKSQQHILNRTEFQTT